MRAIVQIDESESWLSLDGAISSLDISQAFNLPKITPRSSL